MPDRIVQAVDVVDPQPGHLPLGDQLECSPVARFEHLRILDAHADQLRHIEEASVVDLLAGDAPVGEAVPLRIEQRVERRDAVRIVPLAVEPRDRAIERTAEFVVPFVQPPERVLEEAAVRHVLVGGDELAQLDGHAFLRQGVDTISQHEEVRVRRQRQALVVIAEEEALGVEGELDLLRLERFAIRAAEDRQEDLLHRLAMCRDRAPVDVEIVNEARLPPVLEDAHPPGVLGARGHVVRHDVEEQPQPAALQRLMQGVEVVFTAELGVQCGWIDDVIAVRTSLPRPEDRRGVDVGNGEPGQVRDDGLRVAEGEAGVELQAVRSAGYSVHHPRVVHEAYSKRGIPETVSSPSRR